MTFGQRLRELREQAGLGQRQLSRLSGLSLSHIQYLERDLKQPGDATLGKLAQHLPITKRELIAERDSRQPETDLTILLREAAPSLSDAQRERLLEIAEQLLTEK